jgi:putative solute:sodium symporter small subunit
MSAPVFDRRAYWNRTLRRTVVLLSIWFLVGPIMGILLAEPLNQFRLGGIPFGFWMAQQGSIYVFVILIFVYAWLSDRADRIAGVDETPETTRLGTDH